MRRISAISLCLLLTAGNVFGQAKNQYILGEDEKTLFMFVFIIGEVKEPGEYQVQDNTDLAELLSKAGGPTKYSNLNSVTITRDPQVFGTANRGKGSAQAGPSNGQIPNSGDKQIIRFNLDRFLNSDDGPPAPILMPGDIVTIRRNKTYKMEVVGRIMRDIAVVASAYFLYLRAVND